MNIITLERQETLTVTMTLTLTFSVWKSVDSGPVPNRRSIKPSGIINTFFPPRVQNRFQEFYFWAGHLFDWLPTKNTHKLSIFGRNLNFTKTLRNAIYWEQQNGSIDG